eukprot:gene11193-18810_t
MASRIEDSPFVELDRPFTAYEAFKMVVLLPLAIPRALIGCLALVLIALINVLAVLGCGDIEAPMPAWRRRIILASKELLVVVVVMLGFKVTVKGRENIKKAEEAKAVVVFNHVSWLDAFILVWLLAPSGVALARNASIPVLGSAVRALQTIYIPKSKKGGSVTTMLEKRVSEPNYGKLGGYPLLVLAPEGTCSNGKCLLKFKTGAFVLGRPILPILYKYKHKHHNPAWTVIIEPWHFLRLLCQWVNFLEVEILPPYFPNEDETKDPLLFAENVRKLMSEKLGLPMVEDSQADYLDIVKSGVSVSWDGRRIIHAQSKSKSE